MQPSNLSGFAFSYYNNFLSADAIKAQRKNNLEENGRPIRALKHGLAILSQGLVDNDVKPKRDPAYQAVRRQLKEKQRAYADVESKLAMIVKYRTECFDETGMRERLNQLHNNNDTVNFVFSISTANPWMEHPIVVKHLVRLSLTDEEYTQRSIKKLMRKFRGIRSIYRDKISEMVTELLANKAEFNTQKFGHIVEKSWIDRESGFNLKRTFVFHFAAASSYRAAKDNILDVYGKGQEETMMKLLSQ